MNNRQEKPPLKCLLGIDPEKTQKCKPSECASCGAHLDSGEKCDCRTAEADDNAEKELKEMAKDNDRN